MNMLPESRPLAITCLLVGLLSVWVLRAQQSDSDNSVTTSPVGVEEGPTAVGAVHVPSGTVVGMAISQPQPVYPAVAKAAHVQGTVVLHAIISKTGIVEDLTVISGPPLLQASAIDTVRQWRYKPYFLRGVPTEVDTTINVNFAFGDSPAAPTGTDDNQVGSGASINTPVATAIEPSSEEQREQFAAQLSTNRKDSGELYAISGNRKQVLEAIVPGGSNVVALLANSVGAALSANGFLEIHITLPDGKGGANEWLALISPSGYGEARSTMYCSITNQPPPGSRLCSESKQLVFEKGRDDTPEAREQIAKTLTDQSAQHGRHNVYTICGKNGGQDGLCIVDLDAPEDGFVQRTGANTNLGQMFYAAGFRTLLVSNGKGGYWGSDISSAGFVPMHSDGTSSVSPADPNGVPPSSSASAPSANKVGSLIEQAHSAALDEGAKMIEQKVREAATAREDSLIKHGTTATSPQAEKSKVTAFNFDPYEQIRMGMTAQEVTSILQGRAVGTNVDEGVDDGPPRPSTKSLLCIDHRYILGEKECVSKLYRNPYAEMMTLMFYHDHLFYMRSGCRGCTGLISKFSKAAGIGPGPQCGPTPSNGAPRRSWHIGATAVCVSGREDGYLQVDELNWRIAPPGTLPQ